VVGANSEAGLASRPIRIILADEIDRYPPSAGAEGDPLSLAIKRTRTIWNRRIVMVLTPTIKGISRIEQEWERLDDRLYYVGCTHCGHKKSLSWGHVKWPDGKPEEANVHCEDCGARWSEAERLVAILWGVWRATSDEGSQVGFHINEITSPWAMPAQMAVDFLKAKGSPEQLKMWVNTSLGLPWEERSEGVVMLMH